MTDLPTRIGVLDDPDDAAGFEDPGEDMDLVLEFLQKRLDPERMALVQQRLQDDPEFLHMAEPIILAWNIPLAEDLPPVTRAQVERSWDEFTRRAGFIHQRRRARHRLLRMLGIVLLVVGAGAWFSRDAVATWYHDWRDYTSLAPGAMWTTIGTDAEARVTPGGVLRVPRVPPDTGADVVKLAGVAEFRIARPRLNPMKANIRLFSVATPAAVVSAVWATFDVRTAGDTTYVSVREPEVRERTMLGTLPTFVHADNRQGEAVIIGENQRGRIVKGQPPEVLP